MMPHSDYEITSVTSDQAVQRLQPEWDRLSESAANPNVFTTFGWFQAWYRGLQHARRSERKRPNVLVVRINGVATGIVPLVRTIAFRKGILVRKLSFAFRWDYNDFVVGAQELKMTEAVVDFLARNCRQWDVIDLHDLRSAEDALLPLSSALTRAGLCFRFLPEEERCPYLTFDGPWADFLSKRSSATRHTFRNRLSRLDKLKGLRMRIIERPDLEAGLLERMIVVESRKQVGGIPSEPYLGLYKEVFASIFANLGPKGWIRVALMELDDCMLAWHLIFRCGGKLWGYLTAFDHAYSYLSPGTMLIPSIMDHGFALGCTEYDFLSGEEPYKMKWAQGFHRTFRLVVWNQSWMSRMRASIGLGLTCDTTPAAPCDFSERFEPANEQNA